MLILDDEYFVNFVCWGHDSRKIYCSGLKGINRHVFSVDIRTGRKEVIVDRTGWTYLAGISRDGRKLLTVLWGLLTLPDAHLISLDTGEERAVTQFSDQLANYELADASVVEWESYDGLVIQGCVVPPVGKSMSPRESYHRRFARRTDWGRHSGLLPLLALVGSQWVSGIRTRLSRESTVSVVRTANR